VKHSLFGLGKKAEADESTTGGTNVINYHTNPGMDEFELELAPLLPPQPNFRQRRDEGKQALVIINRDDGHMSIGLNQNALTNTVSSQPVQANINRRNDEENAGLLDRFNLFPAGSYGNNNHPNHRIVPTHEV
jgi:hypothetical protein